MMEYDVFINILTALFAAIYASFVMQLLLKKRIGERDEAKKKFFKALLEGLKIGAINTIDDIENVYRGIGVLSSEEVSYRYRLSRWLREFMVALISKEIEKSIEDKTLIEWKEKISGFIQKIEEVSPYSDLPDIERSILIDISTYLENGNRDAVERKLSEIASIIQARNDDLNKIKSTNKWAVPLAVVGMILTVVFGLLSIFT
ncbi:MAG: hypothetical protein C4B56_04270 [Candidatus Methanophagaceae archaeon]|nr:MAG: hypothetical protein C4B56_04270 [Methanophagales archaeon]